MAIVLWEFMMAVWYSMLFVYHAIVTQPLKCFLIVACFVLVCGTFKLMVMIFTLLFSDAEVSDEEIDAKLKEWGYK